MLQLFLVFCHFHNVLKRGTILTGILSQEMVQTRQLFLFFLISVGLCAEKLIVAKHLTCNDSFNISISEKVFTFSLPNFLTSLQSFTAMS